MVIALPVMFALKVNGDMHVYEWNLWSMLWVGMPEYRELRSRTRPFEVMIPIRRGVNTITIAIPAFYLVSVPGARIDIKFLDKTGRPLTFDGMRIVWTATEKDPT
jgi:hypothetical protein